ncbi:phosphoenolpyruvate hydrolase family protein [Virgibacillus sp. NKC19-3]|uniref:phosphoenolpyruvate hydrolase family protein n=1 Tax=Virgibacillus saliphilus TaxID=2831674 RepID=UPI001C9AAD4C|nr:phosphoenolpyruvate hydrolase family protein [Virgibacillus sp. NKC19-3]MBY7144523.1 phosphoenolpyruvate hydrolase family protein [Virgibacillus sp. NKC19-3]
MDKQHILGQFQKQIKKQLHLIGVAAGSGLTAKYAESGGADFILALSSGIFRQKGISSLAGYLPIASSNQVVMEFASKELLPTMKHIPIIFGLSATDPGIDLEDYIKDIKARGFAGVNNYPTIGLIGGQFREALEEEGITYAMEVEAIRLANKEGLFTVAFVFNEQQAIDMLDAGADVICIHLGLTTGGVLGGKQIKSLQWAKRTVMEISQMCKSRNPYVITMVYGGPLNQPQDVQFIYDRTMVDGYIGGSAIERIPAEQLIAEVTQSFKTTNDVKHNELIQKIINGVHTQEDYIDFIQKYISLHYGEDISLNDLTEILNVSRSYLSTLFKEKVGVSFTDYLIDFRLNRAIEIIHEKKLPLKIVADMVGYPNYAQFSKIFKKRKGKSPKLYFE